MESVDLLLARGRWWPLLWWLELGERRFPWLWLRFLISPGESFFRSSEEERWSDVGSGVMGDGEMRWSTSLSLESLSIMDKRSKEERERESGVKW